MHHRHETDFLRNQWDLQALLDDYSWHADMFQFEDWSETFTEDAVFEHRTLGATFRGRTNIRDAFIEMVHGKIARTQHIVTNCRFDLVDGDRATGHGNLFLISVPNGEDLDHHVQSGGIYNWEFEKSDRWRISRSRLETIWQSSTLIPPVG